VLGDFRDRVSGQRWYVLGAPGHAKPGTDQVDVEAGPGRGSDDGGDREPDADGTNRGRGADFELEPVVDVGGGGVPQVSLGYGEGDLAIDETSAIWFVNLPHAEPLSAAQAQQTPASERLPSLAAKFAEDRTPAARLISRTDPAELLIVGSMENMPRLRIFTKLAKPEKMAWMFDYRIDWNAPATPAALASHLALL
jgi:hypothetical protein